MKNALVFTALLVLLPLSASAAVFDAPDILPENSGAVGVFGELLLNDPTSEGVEARARYGYTDDWNFAGILGMGSKNKKFRLGGETVYSIIPDWEGQIGLSALASLQYIRRSSGGGLQLRVGLMGHKKVDSFTGYPATLYLALPFQLEARKGSYTSGSQFVMGSLWDINSQGRFYASTELGIKIGNAESYVLFGAGFRLGELRFQKKSRGSSESRQRKSDEPEYRDEDFQ